MGAIQMNLMEESFQNREEKKKNTPEKISAQKGKKGTAEKKKRPEKMSSENS